MILRRVAREYFLLKRTAEAKMKMSEELEQLLKNLHLKRILEIYDEQPHAAEKEDVSYSEFLTRLLRAQWHARQESALEWRIRRANLPERWSLETFPFARQPGVNRKQIRTLAELEFIAKAENIVFIGETAVGQNRIGLWSAAEGAGERLPRTVRPRPRPVRRNVCLAGRSFHAPVAQTPGSPGRPCGRRAGLSKSQTRAVQHLLQADGRALPPPFHHYHHES